MIAAIGVVIVEGQISRVERQRAESRFNDVRQIADSLIFELDDSVAKLEGSTSTRRLLVEKAVRYLDLLSREAKRDVALQRDLGNAFDKLGNIQGNPYLSNLGLVADARRSYDKAIVIREQLVAENPRDSADRLALATSYDRLADFLMATTADLSASRGFADKAAALAETLYHADPENSDAADALIDIYQTLGDIAGGSGATANEADAASAVEYSRKAIAIAERTPGNAEAEVARRAELDISLGDRLVKLGDRSKAIEVYRGCLKRLKDVPSGVGEGERAALAASALRGLGNAQMVDGTFQLAVDSYRQAYAVYEHIVGGNPDDVQARDDLAATRALYGNALVLAGDTQAGLNLLDDAIGALRVRQGSSNTSFTRRLLMFALLLRGQVAESTGDWHHAATTLEAAAALLPVGADVDLQATLTLAGIEVKMGDARARLGDVPAAREAFEHALSRLQSLSPKAHAVLDVAYTSADAYYGIGTLEFGAVDPAPASRERCQRAQPWFERSLEAWRLVKNPGSYDPSGFYTRGPRAVQRLSASCVELR